MNKIQRMTEGQTILDEKAAEQYAAFLDERAKGRPLQYILGEWEFMGLPFSVGEGVLIPRADTEILVETILETGERESLCRGLDIGTGTGCIPICLEKLGHMDMTAVDISPKALAFARENNEKIRPMWTLWKATCLQLCRKVCFLWTSLCPIRLIFRRRTARS